MKRTNRLVAGALALLMVLLMIPISPIHVDAATTTYTFDATTLTAAADKEEIASGTKLGTNDFFTTVGVLTKRTSKTTGDVVSVELAKKNGSSLQFTVDGTASLSLVFSSTGSTNESAIGIYNAAGTLVNTTDGKDHETTIGASDGKKTVTYQLPAGTYSIAAPVTGGAGDSRNTRLYSVEVVVTTDAPTEPSSEPTEPSSEPTEPSSEPTEPSSEPTEPSSEPTEPSSEPTEPSSEPTEPSSEPTEPSSEPTEPSTAPSSGKTYTFDAKTDVKLEGDAATKDKAEIPAGTTYADGFLKIVGTVTQRYDETKGGVYCVEVAKAEKGSFEFTITGTADVAFTASSTGGSNTSAIGLINAETGDLIANNENITTVTGTAATKLTYTNLPAGTYRILSPTNAEFGRGARVMNITVTEYPVVVTTEYTFNAKTDVKLEGDAATKDKAAIPAGTTYADGFLKIVGTVTQRYDETKGGVYCVEVAKAEKGSFEFTVTGTADVAFTASSTGGSNTSAIGLINAETGDLIANNENITTVTGTAATKLTYTALPAGTYRILSPTNAEFGRGARIMTISITHTSSGEAPARKSWEEVAAPVIVSAEQTEGSITVVVQAEVSRDGADSLTVTMLDKDGKELAAKTVAESGSEHTVTFDPSNSGDYTFKALISRSKETDKEAAESKTVSFLLPLSTPAISSATSKGDGKIEVVWSAVNEAESYELYVDGKLEKTTTETRCTVEGLTVGTKYSFTVIAIRGTEKSAESAPLVATATADAKTTWGFTRYGPSTNDSGNGYIGNLNEDGKVTVYSEGGKGKVQPQSADGVAFYYTAIPNELNFTLRANVHVDSWTLSNGQEGFGLLATDSLAPHGTSTFWTNQYMAMASKIEYHWDAEKGVPNADGTKYSMKIGIGVNAKLGITPENQQLLYAADTATIKMVAPGTYYPLETSIAKQGLAAGTYNVIGNSTKEVPNTVAQITDFVLEIQRNNTGYLISCYDLEGNLLGQQKNYDPNALSALDKENVYVGFFAARNARATFSNVKLTTIAPKDDAPAEEKPVTKIEPKLTLPTAPVANSPKYTLAMTANVAGTASVAINGKTVLTDLALTAGVRLDQVVELPKTGTNKIVVTFKPDPNQDLGEDTVLASTDPVESSVNVNYNVKYANQNNLYIAPNGKPNGNGGPEYPLDVYTAVSCVQPGQTIVVMEGTYKLERTVRIERGMDGTAENNIRMVVDPNAKTRPVFDFQGKCAGFVHGGNYWYFQGFDVTNSADAQKGFQVSGDSNILDQINAYHNGNTGIQISRLYGSDEFADWPANNLILNCTSYGNADFGYEDADGFAAKLTIGEGNVFDGCVAHHNADDGWDLFAKVSTGPIGAVTIRNCVAYSNGYLEDGTRAGNGNGFKMGGDGLTGHHKLINSIAFNNKAKGIDSNSCPDIIVENSTSYNNESYNVAFYTKNNANTDFSATGIVSFKDASIKSGLNIYEDLDPKGNQDITKIMNDSNYYWNGSCKNTAGDEITADMFVSLEFKGILRNSDGTINMQGFLELNDKAPKNVGAKMSGTASGSVTITPDKDLPIPTGDTAPILLWAVLLIASAGALGCAYGLRKRS